MKTNLPKKQNGGTKNSTKMTSGYSTDKVRKAVDPSYFLTQGLKSVKKGINKQIDKTYNSAKKKVFDTIGPHFFKQGGAPKKMQMGGMIGMMSPGNLGKGSLKPDTRTAAQKAADAKKQAEFLKQTKNKAYNAYKDATDPKKRAAAQKQMQQDIKSGKIKISRNGGAIKSKK
jgi:hypothetical protein